MVRGHMNIVGVPPFTKLVTNTACITRDLYMFTLNVVIKICRLGHVTAHSTLPLSTS